MSRVDFEPKGSKGTMKCLVEEHEKEFSKLLNGNIEWISPTKAAGYKEFQLNKSILNWLGLPVDALKDFWPERGPQWDGIALDYDNKILYLLEAKSHFSEISPRSNNSDKSESNLQMIKESISDIKNYYGSNADIKDIWMDKYYQIANRLAFLKKMKKLSSEYDEAKYKDVKLIFLNFENDPTWGKDIAVPKGGWNKKYDQIWKEMDIDKNQLEKEGVLKIDIDTEKW